VAGKVTGPGNGPPGNVPIGGPDEARPIDEGRAPFADKLKPTSPAGTAGVSAAPPAASGVTDLAAALKAGTLSPQAAVDQVIDRIVDKQLGAQAPTAAREKLRAALESAVADDPLLAEKIRSLA
jgi:hypothetical protein